MIFPDILKPGDLIRVVSPSMSLSFIKPDQRQMAMDRLSEWGLQVSFSRHAEETDRFHSSSVSSPGGRSP